MQFETHTILEQTVLFEDGFKLTIPEYALIDLVNCLSVDRDDYNANPECYDNVHRVTVRVIIDICDQGEV